jgi:hypothetical protein
MNLSSFVSESQPQTRYPLANDGWHGDASGGGDF